MAGLSTRSTGNPIPPRATANCTANVWRRNGPRREEPLIAAETPPAGLTGFRPACFALHMQSEIHSCPSVNPVLLPFSPSIPPLPPSLPPPILHPPPSLLPVLSVILEVINSFHFESELHCHSLPVLTSSLCLCPSSLGRDWAALSSLVSFMSFMLPRSRSVRLCIRLIESNYFMHTYFGPSLSDDQQVGSAAKA